MAATSPGGGGGGYSYHHQHKVNNANRPNTCHERLPSLGRIDQADEIIEVLKAAESQGPVYFDVTRRTTKGRYRGPPHKTRQKMMMGKRTACHLQPPPEAMQRFAKDVLETDPTELYHLLRHSSSSSRSRPFTAAAGGGGGGTGGTASHRLSTTTSSRLSLTAPCPSILPSPASPSITYWPYTSQVATTGRKRSRSALGTIRPWSYNNQHHPPSPNRLISTATTTGLYPFDRAMSPIEMLQTIGFDGGDDQEGDGDRAGSPSLSPTHATFLRTLLQPPPPPTPQLSPNRLEQTIEAILRMATPAGAPPSISGSPYGRRPLTSTTSPAAACSSSTAKARSQSAAILGTKNRGFRTTSARASSNNTLKRARPQTVAGGLSRPISSGMGLQPLPTQPLTLQEVTHHLHSADPAGPGALDQVLELNHAMHYMGETWAAGSLREAQEMVKLHADIAANMKAVNEEIEKTAARLERRKKLKAALEAKKHMGVMTKGLATLKRFYDKMMKTYMAWGMARWKRASASVRSRRLNNAATTVAMSIRRFYCRRLVQKMRLEVAYEKQKQENKLRAKWRLTHSSATDIQRVWRGYMKGRKVLARKRREVHAAFVIQRTRQRALAKQAAWFYIRAMEHKDELATRIQSAYRGWRTRRACKRTRVRRRHEEIEDRLAVYQSQVSTNFTLKGAAIRIQRAWRRSHWRLRKLVAKLKIRRQQAALTLQGFSRIIRAKRRVNQLRLERQQFTKRVKACLTFYVKCTLWIAAQRAPKQTFLALPASIGNAFNFITQQIPTTPGKQSVPSSGLNLKTNELQPCPEALNLTVPLTPSTPKASTPRPFLSATTIMSPSSSGFTTSKIGPKIQLSLATMTLPFENLLSPERARQRRLQREAAIRIAVVVKRFLKRRRARAMRDRHMDLVAKKVLLLQRWYRRHRLRKQKWIRRAKARLIQRSFRQWLVRKKAKIVSAIRIQQEWRARVKRKKEKARHKVMTHLARSLQRYGRGILARRRVGAMRDLARRRREIALVGRAEHAALVETEKKRQVLWFSSIPDVQAMGELQRLFLYYTAAKGRYEINDQDKCPLTLDTQRFSKLCTSIPGLANKDFSIRTAELICDDVLKTTGSKVLDYGDFVTVMKRVADIRLKKIRSFGRFCGNEARFIKLSIETIYPASSVKKILDRMPKEDHYASRAITKIRSDTVTIQRVYRGYKGRCRAERRRQEHKKEMEHERLSHAATRIQNLWRKFKARDAVSKLASQIYEKCVDPDTKQAYYLNPRTGRATWDKPTLLHSHTLNNPIMLPDADRDFSILCGVCNRSAARKWCLECNDYFCIHDFLLAHKKGKAVNHRAFAMDLCVQCSIQVASRHCPRCDDDYCCTCFTSIHRRGQLQLHFSMPLTDMCATCTKWMALKTCDTCQVHLCRVCARYEHEAQGHMVRDKDYMPTSVRKYFDELEVAKEKEMILASYKNRQEYLKQKAQEQAAIKIQSLYRGYRARKPFKEVIGSREEMRQHRRADERVRHQHMYQLLDLFGKAPELTTDGPKERVLKKYPMRVRSLVAETVDGDWITALKMVLEQEEFLKEKLAHKEPPVAKVKAVLEGQLQHAKLTMALNTLAFKLEANEVKLKEAQTALKEARGQAAKDVCRKAVKQYKTAIGVNRENLRDTKKAMDTLVQKQEQRLGPDKLNKAIKFFQRRGRQLPFLVKARQGHAYFKCESALAQKLRRGEDYWIGKKVEHAQKFKIRQVETRTHTEGRHEIVECMLFTDRDWTGPDEDGLSVFKVPNPLPLERPIKWLLYQLDYSPIVQGPLKAFILAIHQAAMGIESMAANFDEESPYATKLNAQAGALLRVESLALRHRYRHMRLAHIPPKGIIATTRVVVGKTIELALKAKATFEKVQKKMKKKDPYTLWELSPEKERMVVLWREEETEVEQMIGEVVVDVDIPVYLLREKLRRRLREPLNKKNGGGFVFRNGKNPLSRYYEGKKRARDILDKRTDEATSKVDMIVIVMLDPEAAFQEIPDIPDVVPEVEEEIVEKKVEKKPVVKEDAWSVFLESESKEGE